MTTKATGLAAGMLIVALFPAVSIAQPLSNEGWSYNAGSNLHAQSQILRKQQKATASATAGAGGGSGGGSGSTVIVNNATTIGNMTEIHQILEQGAQAYLNTNTNQNTTGTQSSSASGLDSNTRTVTTTNSATSTTTNSGPAGAGAH